MKRAARVASGLSGAGMKVALPVFSGERDTGLVEAGSGAGVSGIALTIPRPAGLPIMSGLKPRTLPERIGAKQAGGSGAPKARDETSPRPLHAGVSKRRVAAYIPRVHIDLRPSQRYIRSDPSRIRPRSSAPRPRAVPSDPPSTSRLPASAVPPPWSLLRR